MIEKRFVVRYGNFEVHDVGEYYTVRDRRRPGYEPVHTFIPNPAIAALAAQDLCRWERLGLVTDEEREAHSNQSQVARNQRREDFRFNTKPRQWKHD